MLRRTGFQTLLSTIRNSCRGIVQYLEACSPFPENIGILLSSYRLVVDSCLLKVVTTVAAFYSCVRWNDPVTVSEVR